MKLFNQCARRWVILVAALMAPPLTAEPEALSICAACHGKNGVGLTQSTIDIG